MAGGVRTLVSRVAAMWAVSGSFHRMGVDAISVRVHRAEREGDGEGTITGRWCWCDGETEQGRVAHRSWLCQRCPWPKINAIGWTVLPRPCRSFEGSQWWWWVLKVVAVARRGSGGGPVMGQCSYKAFIR
jgi:hypothetical protein